MSKVELSTEVGPRSANGVRNRRNHARLLAALLAGTAFTTPSLAQSAEDPAPQESSAQDSAAQDSGEGDAGEVVVTGIRRSIIAGLEDKRRSDVIVETIRAEDIMKFPDKNLAEALQRVPGVSIDRDGGEGRYVTLQGLSGDFVNVLFNNRRIASEGFSRTFSFDLIPSDMVGGVNVYKTQQSYIREGGVGGTIDVRTRRPLDRKGLNVAGKIEGIYEQNSKNITPNASVTVSDTFLDDRLGVILGLTYQHRKNRTYSVDGGKAFVAESPFAVDGGFDSQGQPFGIWGYGNFGVNPAYRMRALTRTVSEDDRTRKGFYGAVQFKPVDALDINLDYMRSDFNAKATTYSTTNWIYSVTPPPGSEAGVIALGRQYANDWGMGPEWAQKWVDWANKYVSSSRTKVDENGVVTGYEMNDGRGSQGWATGVGQRPTLTQMWGANVAYDISDNLKFVADAALATARLNNPNGNSTYNLEVTGVGRYYLDATGNVPAVTEIDQTMRPTFDNYQNIQLRKMIRSGSDIKARNYEYSGELRWNVNNDFKLRVGALYEQGNKKSTDYSTPNDVNHCFVDCLTFASGYTTRSAAELESLTNGILKLNPSLFGQPEGSINDTFKIDPKKMEAYLADPANLQRLRDIVNSNPGMDAATKLKRIAAIDAFQAGGATLEAKTSGVFSKIREKVFSAYFDVDGDFKLFGMPGHVTAGVRYTHTKLDATGFANVLIAIVEPDPPLPGQFQDPNFMRGVFADPSEPGGLTELTLDNSYHNFLPSVNVKFEVTPDIILRLAASQSLTRPTLQQMIPFFSFGSIMRIDNGRFANNRSTATSSNPNLKPYRSTNFDASLEWYPAPAANLAVGVFQKNVKDWILESTDFDQKIPTLSSQYDQYNHFDITKPDNVGNVRIRGITIAGTYTFDFGLGFQANYTRIGTNRPFDPVGYDQTKLAIAGMSNSMNLVAFYEKNGISARVAYNRREKFLRNALVCSGVYSCQPYEPAFAKPYEQIDIRVGYDITKAIQVYAEGINITKAELYQTGRFDNLFYSYENFGPRYTVGATFKF